MKKKIPSPIIIFALFILQSCVDGALNPIFIPRFRIYAVSPVGGNMAGGTNLSIIATGVKNGASVMVGSSACTPVVLSPGQVTCTTSTHVAQNVSITITNPNGATADLNNAYTYLDIPTITTVTPISGSLTGGTAVTINGTNFFQGATINLGANACNNLTVMSSTVIQCTTAANTAGLVDATITNIDGQTATLAGVYTYQPAPIITTIVPISGSPSGGTIVNITGLNFMTGATVSFGIANCAVTVVTPVLITCTTSANSMGLVDVEVTNPDNQSATLTSGFNYINPPVIISISPTIGSTAGGTSFTITGSGFVAGATVSVGGNACTTVTVNSATEVICVTPAGAAGGANVDVTNPDMQAYTQTLGFVYTIPPTVTNIAPNNGFAAGSTPVVITGTGFMANATVSLGGSSCTANTITPTQISCTTTIHAGGVVDVDVTNPDTQTGSLTAGYTYNATPTITTVTPIGGPVAGGTLITIDGNGYVAGITAFLGGIPCIPVSFVSANQITCTTAPNIPGTTSLTLTNPDTQTVTMTSAYTYGGSPVISSVNPTIGSAIGGTLITISGSGFINGATVDVGGNACTTVIVVNSSQITCITPAGIVGGVDLVVTNPDTQTDIQNLGFLYTNGPTVASITPIIGVDSGGETVTIAGTSFFPGASISLGGAACTPITIAPAQITCTTGPRLTGLVDVVVTNPDSQSATLTGSFTYNVAPAITTVTPNGGLLAGATPITIDGNNFVTGATITVGANACTAIIFVSTSQLTCVTPAGTAGAADVVVTNPNTQTGTLTGGYTYRPAPTLTSINPTFGPTVGGNTITFTGTGFLTGATVSIGGIACAVATVTAIQITCTAGTNSAGMVDAIVTNPDTLNASLLGVYTYNLPPTITTITPISGLPAGGGTLTISGINFVSGATVGLGGNACIVVTNVPAQITCTTPAGAIGTVSVIVTNPDTQTSTLTNSFSYQDSAVLSWIVGTGTPNPPNPDDYGITTANITHTFTLQNNGNITTSVISVFTTGTDAAAWYLGTDNCTGVGNELAPGASCTVQVTFISSFVSTTGNYTATLRANAAVGGFIDNNILGEIP